MERPQRPDCPLTAVSAVVGGGSSSPPLPAPDEKRPGERPLDQLQSLLKELEGQPIAVPEATAVPITSDIENQLIQVRLGIAGGLFAALRAKHEHTARHCLRVALQCSSFATMIGLPEDQRDELELAALLHDIGKIGIPDNVLLKPGQLTPQEIAIMEGHWELGQTIAKCCCATPGILDIMQYARTWYDGTRGPTEKVGDNLPIGSRLLMIVDAYDAMLTDQVYRMALSQERACEELYRHAGTQFDPSLVMLFIKLSESDKFNRPADQCRVWLRELHPEAANRHWRRPGNTAWAPSTTAAPSSSLFEQKLLESMYDAVVFLDSGLKITMWNRGAERLTGISSEGICDKMWIPSLLKMRDEHGRLVRDNECPMAEAVSTGEQWLRRMMIYGRNGRQVNVDMHCMPVLGSEGAPQGVVLSLHDVSPEISLEERCQNLREIATKDPLTQVANRAEFDRTLELFVAAHLENQRPCSLIISDIDRFKSVNDTYGHQAGDEVIQCFARLQQGSCRQGDLVARYGGEEFVLLCADCDNATATRRAEEVREAFAQIPQPMVDNRCVTASFGVTEVQPGDTPETMLRRADRALLLAKENGRNRVVQLGTGCGGANSNSTSTTGESDGGSLLISQALITLSGLDRTVEKLKGFIADQHAEIISIDEGKIRIGFGGGGIFRRATDPGVRLLMDMQLEEDKQNPNEQGRGGIVRTRIHVEIRPQRSRDRRKADALDRARQLMMSVRQYLMATDSGPMIEVPVEPESGLLTRVASNLFPWNRKRGITAEDDR